MTTTTTPTAKAPQSKAKDTDKKLTKAAAKALAVRNVYTYSGKIMPKGSPTITPNDDGSLSVDLFGKHGVGKTMTIDAADWESVSAVYGQQWLAVPRGNGSFYVGSGRGQATANVRQPNSRAPTAVLTRLLMDPKDTEMVAHRNGDWSDIRRKNLNVLPASEAAAWRSAARQAKAQAKAAARYPELFADLFARTDTTV